MSRNDTQKTIVGAGNGIPCMKNTKPSNVRKLLKEMAELRAEIAELRGELKEVAEFFRLFAFERVVIPSPQPWIHPIKIGDQPSSDPSVTCGPQWPKFVCRSGDVVG